MVRMACIIGAFIAVFGGFFAYGGIGMFMESLGLLPAWLGSLLAAVAAFTLGYFDGRFPWFSRITISLLNFFNLWSWVKIVKLSPVIQFPNAFGGTYDLPLWPVVLLCIYLSALTYLIGLEEGRRD